MGNIVLQFFLGSYSIIHIMQIQKGDIHNVHFVQIFMLKTKDGL